MVCWALKPNKLNMQQLKSSLPLKLLLMVVMVDDVCCNLSAETIAHHFPLVSMIKMYDRHKSGIYLVVFCEPKNQSTLINEYLLYLQLNYIMKLEAKCHLQDLPRPNVTNSIVFKSVLLFRFCTGLVSSNRTNIFSLSCAWCYWWTLTFLSFIKFLSVERSKSDILSRPMLQLTFVQ